MSADITKFFFSNVDLAQKEDRLQFYKFLQQFWN